MKSKESLKTYLDGFVVRYKNRRISLLEKDGSTMIKFEFADKDANGAACYHKCHKGKIRETFLKMNDEAMHRIVYAWFQLQMEKKKRKS